MIPPEDYVTLYHGESVGSSGAFGIKILVAHSANPDLNTTAIYNTTYEAACKVAAEIRAEVLRADGMSQVQAKKEREDLLGLFPGRIFVETIPNGYCSDWCCRHLPWFVVTTEVGRITISWRKSVISINWEDTVGTKTAAELFEYEDVTKGNKSIHAWSLQKAQDYVNQIIITAER